MAVSGTRDERQPLKAASVGTVQTDATDKATFVFICVLVISLAPISFGYAMGYTSPTGTQINAALNLTSTQGDLYTSFINIGAVGGAIGAGRLADVIGRKATVAASCFMFAGGWALIALAFNFASIFSGRFIVGIGVGMVATVIPVYIAEISPSRLRGLLGAANQLAIVTGVLLVYVLGLGLGFRNLAMLGAIIAGVLFLVQFFLPRTPRFLLSKGETVEAENTLRKLRGEHYDVSREIQDMQENMLRNPAGGLRDLFTAANLKPLGIGVVLMVLQQLCGINVVMFNAGTILQDAGMDNPNVGAIAIAGVQVVITLIAAALMDRAGRRMLLLISLATVVVALAVLGVFFYEKDHGVTSLNWLALVALLVYIAGFGLGLGPVAWLIMGELFPAKVRGLAASIATVTNWGCSFAATVSFSAMKAGLTSAGTYWLYMGICVAGFLFVLAVVPETKGKTLEEIEALFAPPSYQTLEQA